MFYSRKNIGNYFSKKLKNNKFQVLYFCSHILKKNYFKILKIFIYYDFFENMVFETYKVYEVLKKSINFQCKLTFLTL